MASTPSAELGTKRRSGERVGSGAGVSMRGRPGEVAFPRSLVLSGFPDSWLELRSDRLDDGVLAVLDDPEGHSPERRVAVLVDREVAQDAVRDFRPEQVRCDVAA